MGPDIRTQKRRQYLAWAILLALLAIPSTVAAQNSGPARDAWQHPEEVMDELGIHRGSVVADVGSGAGYFTFHLADRVGPQGRVYAEDILESRLNEIQQEASKEGAKQVTTVLGTPDDPHLPPSSLDVVLAMNTFHEWRQYQSMLKHLYEALKPGGLFGLIDAAAPPGHPRSYYYDRHRMPEEMERADLTQAGFHFLRQERGFKDPDSGKLFYFLVFQRPK